MQEDIIIQISNKIKEKRKAKGITVQELADKADVSKGLISQIENNRTVPSLLVLVNIIRALNLDMNEFFNDINQNKQAAKVLVIKKTNTRASKKKTPKDSSINASLPAISKAAPQTSCSSSSNKAPAATRSSKPMPMNINTLSRAQ